MTILKQLALAAALAVVGVQANAATESEQFVIDPLSNLLGNIPGHADSLFNFTNDTFGGDSRLAGDKFVDGFAFNILDAQSLAFYANSAIVPTTGAQEIQFTSFKLTAFGDPKDVYTFSSALVLDQFIHGSVASLDSGYYNLVVSGKILTDGGTYNGQLSLIPAVPEPASVAMLLAGLGMMGVVARRRNKQ